MTARWLPASPLFHRRMVARDHSDHHGDQGHSEGWPRGGLPSGLVLGCLGGGILRRVSSARWEPPSTARLVCK